MCLVFNGFVIKDLMSWNVIEKKMLHSKKDKIHEFWKIRKTLERLVPRAQRRMPLKRKHTTAMKREVKERCSGSFHLAVGLLVMADDSISERPS